MFVLVWLLALLGLGLVDSMPRHHPRVAHFMPYLRGDGLAALRLAKRLHFRYIDQNGNCDRNGVAWVLHWGRTHVGGYRWRWTGQTRNGREVRVRQRDRDVHTLTTVQMSRLRTRKRGGSRPRRATEHIELAAQLHITLCLELKGGRWTVETLTALRTFSEAHDASVILMTLTDGHGGIPGWEHRVDHALAAGWDRVAVLPRQRKPHDWDATYQGKVAVWGSWR